MPRKRMIDPSIWTDDGMANLTPRQQLLFIGLFSNADDSGRLKGSPTAIKLMLPTVYATVPGERVAADLVAVSVNMRHVQLYEVDGRQYIELNDYREWQRIDRPSDSKIPDPPGTKQADSTSIRRALDESSASPRPEIRLVEEKLVEEKLVEPDMSASPDEPPAETPVSQIFGHYRERVQPQARICPVDKIKRRLKRFTTAELLQGIDHFADDWWWMAHNRTRGAPWFFESDARSEQFLNLVPRSEGDEQHGTDRSRAPGHGAYDPNFDPDDIARLGRTSTRAAPAALSPPNGALPAGERTGLEAAP